MTTTIDKAAVNDVQLLRDYAERKSDEAFAVLVSRYIDLVYSVALRKTGNAHDAEEITQAVQMHDELAARLSAPVILTAPRLVGTASGPSSGE